MARFQIRRRFGAARPLALAAAFAAPPAHAARPMITDDARIVEARSCQVESWYRGSRGRAEYWALPACNFTGNLELTAGGARTRADGPLRTTDLVVQGKTLLKTLEPNGWGIALAAGFDQHPQGDAGDRDDYAYVPASFSFRDDAVVAHANLGWLREGDTRRDHLTWGLGTEVRLSAGTWLIAETFGQDRETPFHQLGLRHWLVTDRIQIDATYGDRNGGDTGAHWFSVGLRLLSAPFPP
jgi:hypothetical protein